MSVTARRLADDPALGLPVRSEQLWSRWPRAYAPLGVTGAMKESPEDFVVTEVAEPPVDEAGEHLYLYVQKRNLSTQVLAERIANQLGLKRQEIGYAGMKDYKAVACQWFSAPVSGSPDIDYGDEVQELRRVRCAKKLRRGELRCNEFNIRLVNVKGADGERLAERLRTIAADGAPNYFGPQRFGRDNLAQAQAWLPFRRRERNAFRRGLHLSVLRSYLFNEVLAQRVEQGSWAQCLPGEVPPSTPDVRLESVTQPDARPSGPLWGRGRNLAGAELAVLEQHVLEPHAELLEALEFTGLKQARRALALRPQDLRWSVEGEALRLQFALAPGTYATSLLRELGSFEAVA